MSTLQKQTIKDYFEHRFFWVISFILSLTAIGQVFMLFGNPFVSSDEAVLKQGESGIEANLLSPVEFYITLGGLESGSYVRVSRVEAAYEAVAGDLSMLVERCLREAVWEEGGTELLPDKTLSCAVTLSVVGNKQLLAAQRGLNEETVPEMSFDQIYVVPALSQGDSVKICFYDSSRGIVHAAFSGEREWTENLSVYHTLLSAGGELLKGADRYVDAGNLYPSRMVKGTFAQESTDRTSAVKGVLSSAFYEGDTFRYALMNTYAYHFFEYPDAVVVSDSDQDRFYTNEKITLKISRDGTMQYVETPTDSEKGDTDLKEAYDIALRFLARDMSAAGEGNLTPVLADYRVGDGEYTFYLDYYVGDIPLVEGGKDSHPVEITVRGSIVHSCRRRVIKVECSEEEKPVHYSWLGALDLSMELFGMVEGNFPVGVPEIVYYDNGHIVFPAWKVTMADGSIRYIPD